MKHILTLGGSNSSTSINRQFAQYAGFQLEGCECTSLDLNDYEMPLYSSDREEASGVPEPAKQFVAKVAEADAIILSLAEHNGSYTAAFKNILDWSSRHEQKLWAEKSMLLLSTSPGGRGAATVMEAAKQYFPRLGANIVASFSLPSFYDTFSAETGIQDEALKTQFEETLKTFAEAI